VSVFFCKKNVLLQSIHICVIDTLLEEKGEIRLCGLMNKCQFFL